METTLSDIYYHLLNSFLDEYMVVFNVVSYNVTIISMRGISTQMGVESYWSAITTINQVTVKSDPYTNRKKQRNTINHSFYLNSLDLLKCFQH